MRIKVLLIWLVLIILPIVAVSSLTSTGENQNALNIVPDRIRIGTFYHGAEVSVTADVENSDAVIVVLEGNNEKIEVNRKDRVAYVWMNVAQMTIEGVPQVYVLAATDDLENISDKKTRADLMLGIESLRPLIKIESDKPLTGKEFDQFVKLKTSDGTYNVNNEVTLKSVSPGKSEVSAILPIPSKIPPDNYSIHMYCFRNGTLVEEKSGNLKIERVGLPGLLINLATNHATGYGLIAIITAMSVGLLIGFIFDSIPGNER